MERQVMQKLIEWKDKADGKPLILKGARQVGKTYILRESGKRRYKTTVNVNCDMKQ